MFNRLPEAQGEAVMIEVDGRRIEARRGDTVAAALLAAGLWHTRQTPVSGSPRAPYCMMGICFDCIITIDGVDNRQGCLVPVTDGMVVTTIKGKRELSA